MFASVFTEENTISTPACFPFDQIKVYSEEKVEQKKLVKPLAGLDQPILISYSMNQSQTGIQSNLLKMKFKVNISFQACGFISDIM